MSKNDSKYSYVINQDVIDRTDEDVLKLRTEAQNWRDKKYKITDRALYSEELPKHVFDVRNSIAPDLEEFGAATSVDGIGDYVRFTGEATIPNGDDPPFDMSGTVGQIVAKANGRIVISTDKGYFGWIEPSDYTKVFVIETHLNYVN